MKASEISDAAFATIEAAKSEWIKNIPDRLREIRKRQDEPSDIAADNLLDALLEIKKRQDELSNISAEVALEKFTLADVNRIEELIEYFPSGEDLDRAISIRNEMRRMREHWELMHKQEEGSEDNPFIEKKGKAYYFPEYDFALPDGTAANQLYKILTHPKSKTGLAVADILPHGNSDNKEALGSENDFYPKADFKTIKQVRAKVDELKADPNPSKEKIKEIEDSERYLDDCTHNLRQKGFNRPVDSALRTIKQNIDRLIDIIHKTKPELAEYLRIHIIRKDGTIRYTGK